jgi:hypothetical protein
MKIKKSKKWEWGHFLARVGLLILFIATMTIAVRVERIVGNANAPNYKDGDLVFVSNYGERKPFLLIRVRGFDD